MEESKDGELLLKDLGDQKFSCRISATDIPEAIAVVNRRDVFVCQNEVNGSTCPDKKGYRYSYSLSMDTRLKDIEGKLLCPYNVGAIISNGKFTRTVLYIEGETIYVSDAEDQAKLYSPLSVNALQKAGYKTIPKEVKS